MHSDGKGSFTDVTAKSGIQGDGLDDGSLLGRLKQRWQGRSSSDAVWDKPLYQNNGDGTFSDVSVQAGIAGGPVIGICRQLWPTWTTTAIWIFTSGTH